EPACLVGETGVGKFHAACEVHERSVRSRHPILKLDGAELQWEDWEWKIRANKEGTVIIEQADLLPADTLRRLIGSTERARLILTARRDPAVAVPTIHVVPLRERTEDIPELVHAFLDKAGAPSPADAISQEAMRMIGLYPFLRDNIKGLKRVVQRAYLLSGGKLILARHIRFDEARKPGSRPKIGVALGSGSVRGAAHVG